MEEWRWMPANLGDYYIIVNIPEFKFRVVSNGQVIHEERIVSGRPDAQSPIFSETMKTVVIQPRWNVPDSIKIKELLPGLRGGGNPLQRQGLVLEYNGRKVDPYNIDWSRTDIRNFNVYQPPGGGNALGVVKFLFPNKHAVYLHDTPSKSLFNEPVRAFSHGCMRVRNPVTLAELILNKDKGWDAAKVQDLIKNGPEENEVGLDHPIPVHVTYFTAWVADDGQVQTFDDVYGHEKRINLALAGRWNQIVKADEKKVSPEDIPNDGWRNDGLASLFGDDDDDDRDERGRRRHKGGIGNFFKQVFGGF
ncbi:MAG: L,D-transpeptidase family protein, partial [Hyphomicrobium sp.]